ncbi:hypothetical protein [Xenorhabdus sp. PB62.4]|uniref:hypothetical protein n=1 Tax=Xenorhabdus sp. PB62.4 TaxID=1851573 RepID=UPI001657025D|nr:hypothetical protein [Xenorhabdus sp. PB62.4]
MITYIKAGKIPAFFRLYPFLRAAQSLPLVAIVVANQFPHSQLNFAELLLLALLLNGSGAYRAPWHGGCAEISCLDQALNAVVMC